MGRLRIKIKKLALSNSIPIFEKNTIVNQRNRIAGHIDNFRRAESGHGFDHAGVHPAARRVDNEGIGITE